MKTAETGDRSQAATPPQPSPRPSRCRSTGMSPIEMDDGLVLRADVFRPVGPGQYPVLLSYGPYGKGLAFQEGYSTAWDIMVRDYPDTARGSSNVYQNWEVVDPEKWVPHGYACVRVDSRGAGRSPGQLDLHSARETRDLAECIEWAGTRRVVHRQGGPGRHFLLRQQPVARGRPAAAPSRGDLRLGRLQRPLSRVGPPRRHPLHVQQELAADAGDHGAARPRRTRPPQPGDRRTCLRARNPRRSRSWPNCGPTSWGSSTPASSTTSTTRPARRSWRMCAFRCSPPATGADRACTCAATSRATCVPASARSGWRCTAARIGRASTRTTATTSSGASSTTSSRARQRLGPAAAACNCRFATSTGPSGSAPKAPGRSSGRAGPGSTCRPATAR